MVTYFNKKDLVEFGNYLLSDERREFLESHPEHPQEIEHRLKFVDHSDVENFLHKKNGTLTITFNQKITDEEKQEIIEKIKKAFTI